MNFRITSEPAIEPLVLSDVKNFLRVTETADDALITTLIMAARRACERHTKRAFITQTWELWLDSFPTGPSHGGEMWWDGIREGAMSSLYSEKRYLDLPMAPLQSLVSLTAFDVNDTPALYDLTNLVVSVARTPGRIALKTGSVWPIATRGADAIQIVFKAGYGDLANTVPGDILQAIYLMVAHMYEHREPVEVAKAGGALQMPLSVDALLLPYVVKRLL